MTNTLYTIGYGLLEGAHAERKEQFQNRLREIQRRLGETLCLVDIRKRGCGSRNGPWCSWEGMRQTVATMNSSFQYRAYPTLSNGFGGTKAGLEDYKSWLLEEVNNPDSLQADAFRKLNRRQRHRPYWAFIFLCGCKDAFKKNGTTPNCHRVPLVEALMDFQPELWGEVVHLR